LNYLYDDRVFFNFENGTTGVKNLDTTSLFSRHPIILPSDNALKKFHEIVINFIDGIYFYGSQSQKLAAIRDTLLPKLISGESNVENYMGGN
jgi:type I restriction enzyme S subunit